MMRESPHAGPERRPSPPAHPGAIHDGNGETSLRESLEDAVWLAADICAAPLAAIALDEGDGWRTAASVARRTAGELDAREPPAAGSLCAHALADLDRVTVIPDASGDARFASLPEVAGEAGIRFWAGAPLVARDGRVLGVLAVMDRRARDRASARAEALARLARQVVRLIERAAFAPDGGRPAERGGAAPDAAAPVSGGAAAAAQTDEQHDEWRRREVDEDRQRFVALIEHSSDLVAMSSPDAHCMYMNPAGCHLLGLSGPDEARAVSVAELVPPDAQRQLAEEIIPAVQSAGRWQGETRMRHFRTGEEIPVLTTVFVVREERTGKSLCIATVARDIRVQKRHEAALEAATAAAESGNRAKSEFLATMSHELRTPMNGVIGFTNLLLDTALDDEQQSFARTIKESAEALLTIINDILDLSKIEAGKLEVDCAPFDLPAVARDVVQLLSAEAQEKGLSLELQIAPDAPRWAHGDAGRVRQVLLNLAGNAVKFTASGGVAVEIGRGPGDGVRVAVIDTGPGIDADRQGRLFQSFSQADSSLGRRFGGTGLGLVISKRLVEAMGGRIGFTSEPGHGSEFWFALAAADGRPARGKDDPDEAADGAALAPIGQGRRVLVAEDNRVNQRLARVFLERLGCAVDVAEDGAEAVYLVQTREYDFVFMDCHMPEMDGYEATAAIRAWEASRAGADPGRARLPIIALTASALHGDRDKCLEAGMDDYLGKPVKQEEIRAAVERWSGRAESRPSPAA